MLKAAPVEPSYTYRAKVTRVVDGDTVVCDIDVGFQMVIRNRSIRMLGVDAPELRKSTGMAAKAYLQQLVEGREIILMTERDNDDKYGRLLGIIYVKRADGQMLNVNDHMFDQRLAL